MAEKWGLVSRNVAKLVDPPRVPRHEIEPLTPEQARQLIEAAAEDRLRTLWVTALATGLRQGELLALRWEDIDLDAGTLTVKRSMQRLVGKGLVFDEPKSRAGRRGIMLPNGLREALRAHRTAQLEERLAAGSEWQEHGLLFAQVNGRPIDPGSDWKSWKALLALASVRDARLHDARHTAATLLLQQGVPARVAMQILGHSQISLTLGTYSHVVPELAQEAADRIDRVLWAP